MSSNIIDSLYYLLGGKVLKKIIYFCFSALVIIISLVNYFNFSYQENTSLYNGLCGIIVENTEKKSNANIISDLKDISADIGSDIFYKTAENNGKLMVIYKTNNSNDFLNINIDENSQILQKNQCISTCKSVKEYDVIPLKMPMLYYDYTIYSFDDCKNARLNKASYCVREEYADNFIESFNTMGYTASYSEFPLYISGDLYELTDYVIFPLIITVLAIFIYFMDNAKEHVLEKMEGYNSYEVILQELKRLVPVLLSIFVVVQIVNVVIYSIVNNGLLLKYIQYNINSDLFIYIAITLMALLVASAIVLVHTGTAYIKGKKSEKTILIITALAKTVLTIVLSVHLVTTVEMLGVIASSINVTNVISDKISNYVNPNVYGDLTDEDYKNLEKFYNLAYERHNGIFVNATEWIGDYESTPFNVEDYKDMPIYVPEGLTLEEVIYINFYSISINPNYLTVNPIYKPDGSPVTEKDFKKDKYNLLVSENEENVDAYITNVNDGYKDILTNNYGGKKLEFNVIRYRQDEIFHIFNTTSVDTGCTYAKNPIVEVKYGMEYELEKNYITSNYDYNQFILETHTANPYNEILPTIKECGLEDVILDVSTATDSVQEYMSQYREPLIKNLITVVMYLALYAFIFMFFINTYLENIKDEIAIRKLSGEVFLSLHLKYLIIALIIAVVVAVSSAVVTSQVYQMFIFNSIVIPLVISVLECVVFKIYSNKFTRKNILKTLKGD